MMKIKLKGSMEFLTDGSYGRTYDKKMLKKEVKEFKKRIGEGVVLGELDHNDNDISLGNVSHKIIGIEMDDDLNYKLDVETLNTPKGQILQELLKGELEIKPSLRGMGDGEDFEIITFDIV